MSKNKRQDTVLKVGGRLALGPSEKLIQAAFKQELEDQAPLFDAMGQADIAHTLVMMEAGVVPPAPGRELLAALLESTTPRRLRPGSRARRPLHQPRSLAARRKPRPARGWGQGGRGARPPPPPF